MKKFIRNLLSGYLLVLLILLIEIAVFIVLQVFLDDIVEIILAQTNIDVEGTLIAVLIYMGFKLIVFVIAFFIFFRILNKAEDPEFKIPWIVGMLLIPLFT